MAKIAILRCLLVILPPYLNEKKKKKEIHSLQKGGGLYSSYIKNYSSVG